MTTLREATEQWIVAGAEPANTETPPVETPAADQPSEAPTVETQPVETQDQGEPPAEQQGVAEGAADAAAKAEAEAKAEGATDAEAKAAGEQAAGEYIEARLNGQPFRIPKNVEIPWKRGKEQGFVPLSQAQAEHMMERDYRVKTAELSQRMREIELERKIEAARIKAREDFLAEQAELFRKALNDPNEGDAYNALMETAQRSPYLRKVMEDAMRGREAIAEQEVRQETAFAEAIQTEVQRVTNWIAEIGSRYPTVDPERVRQIYARELQEERLPISEDAVESIFKQEAQSAERYTAPLQQQIAELTRKLDALSAQSAAAAHNARTSQMIDQAKAGRPVGAPVGGGAAVPSSAPPQLKGRTLRERSEEWAKL